MELRGLPREMFTPDVRVQPGHRLVRQHPRAGRPTTGSSGPRPGTSARRRPSPSLPDWLSVTEATEVTPELVEAFARLDPAAVAVGAAARRRPRSKTIVDVAGHAPAHRPRRQPARIVGSLTLVAVPHPDRHARPGSRTSSSMKRPRGRGSAPPSTTRRFGRPRPPAPAASTSRRVPTARPPTASTSASASSAAKTNVYRFDHTD